MKIILDLNVIIDVLQKRVPHYEFSTMVVEGVINNKYNAYLPAHALTTIHYLVEKFDSHQVANDFVDWMLLHFDVEPATKNIFSRARSLPVTDFEDAVVASMAESGQCDYIITRNVSDFKGSPIPAITPEEFLLIV